MGLNYEEAKRCGLAHLYPTGGKSSLPVVVPPAKSAAPDDGMNKLERRFWGRLEDAHRSRLFASIYREPITLRLAGKTTYRPDFLTVDPFDDRMTCWETKGFMRDDAAVKLKVAAAQYPCFRWVLVQRDRGTWRCCVVDGKGFGRDFFTPDWLR